VVRGFSPFFSPRLGLLAPLLPDRLDVRASAGLSYRTPSFDELFWAPRASAAGNPDLRAEVGRDVDAGFTLTGLSRAARLDVGAFVRVVDDLIQWIPGANGIWRPHNVGSARLAGLELDASVETRLASRTRLRLDASGTHLRTEDRTDDPNVRGKELVYRPRWTSSAALVLTHDERTELEATLRFTDDVWVTRANTKSLAGRVLADLRLLRRLGSGLALDLAVVNVGDVTARDFRDFPLPGRTWRVGVSWERRRP
jgi:outer membrane receptor protein involved in Fe transport